MIVYFNLTLGGDECEANEWMNTDSIRIIKNLHAYRNENMAEMTNTQRFHMYNKMI